MKYDYLKNMIEDIKQFLEDEGEYRNYTTLTPEELEETLNEDLWIEDSITGNGSGSYTFNRWEAEEFINHNFDLLEEALNEFGLPANGIIEHLLNPEWCDVTIRCYLLPQAIHEALKEEGIINE